MQRRKKKRTEELRKLKQLQRTLTFMQSHNFVSSSTIDSNRFLANLILLLVISISVSFLEEASQWIGHEEVAMVGLEAMELENSTLEDFCRSYFMFHGMDINSPQVICKYFPVISFTESYIYQLDGLNEKILYVPTGVTALAKGFEKVKYQGWAETFVNLLEKGPFRPLLSVCECWGLLTERIREEFRSGEEYWALERKLCCALMWKMEALIPPLSSLLCLN